MCKYLCLTLLSITFFSCGNKKISNHPFYITKKITCNDLYENGYRWSLGDDVIYLGKIYNDTTVFYQVSKELQYNNDDYLIYEEVEEETKLDTVTKTHQYQKYVDQDPLILSDSIYTLVWGDLKEQQKQVCENCEIRYRFFKLKIKESEIDDFTDRIDSNRYKIINKKKDNKSYSIKEFQVVNLFKKDTFNCCFYEDNKEFYFSSRKKIK